MTKGAGDKPADDHGRPERPACPTCGSVHTQPFGHAGPAARVNMKCNNCGQLFKAPSVRR